MHQSRNELVNSLKEIFCSYDGPASAKGHDTGSKTETERREENKEGAISRVPTGEQNRHVEEKVTKYVNSKRK